MGDELADPLGGPWPVVAGEFRRGDARHVVASPAAGALAGLDFRPTGTPQEGMADCPTVEQGLTS
jgi:hypothetical protein